MPRAPLAEEGTVDATKPFGDDLDLDALMLRVRDVAVNGTTGGGPAQPQAANEAKVPEPDLISVLEAQGDWNEHARQSLAALVDCIRMLRDDWADVQAGLRREINELSVLVEQMRSAAAPPATRTSAPANTRPSTRRAVVPPRGTGKRQRSSGRRPRS
jgi:hypothetical protein